MKWKKSSLCESSGCVEWAYHEGKFYLRDSKDPNSPVLEFDNEQWTAYVEGVSNGVGLPAYDSF